MASIAWVSIGSSAIASLAYFTALRHVPATRASAWQFLAPVVAVAVEVGRGNAPERSSSAEWRWSSWASRW